MCWDGDLPVNPGEIANNLGLRVVPCGGPGKSYPYSGYFYRDAEGNGVVEYNRGDSPVRRRFTVAHEIGHFVLGHQDSPRDDPDNYRTSVQSPQERAANQFAAELLMPAEELRKLVQSGQVRSIDELAGFFGVSKVAMGYRLANLELL